MQNSLCLEKKKSSYLPYILFFNNGFAPPGIRSTHFDPLRKVLDYRVWQLSRGIAHVPSPLLVGKELFVISNGGVAACVDALTGKEHWRKRLGGNYDASPIKVRDRLYFSNRNGKTTVLSTGKEFKTLATNQLDGTFKASLAVADGALFLRSDTHLYRLEEKQLSK